MTTPPPDQQPAAETPEEIAERLVRTYCAVIDGITLTVSERALANEILSALRNERNKAFDQGYVCAVANIMNLYGEETVAREVLNANRPKDWSIIDELDMKSLQPIFDHEAAQAEIQKVTGHQGRKVIRNE